MDNSKKLTLFKDASDDSIGFVDISSNNSNLSLDFEKYITLNQGGGNALKQTHIGRGSTNYENIRTTAIGNSNTFDYESNEDRPPTF